MDFIMKIGDMTTVPKVGNMIIGKNPQVVKDDISKLCQKGQNIIDDFYLNKYKEIIVSEKALGVLKQHKIDMCIIEAYS